MLQQLQSINPSAKAPLFRRLMSDEDLAYLREKKSIIGFELDLEADQRLSGFTLVGIQKHTIYAFRSDLSETPRLILFPPLDKLFDSTFEMLELEVIKTEFTGPDFQGRVIDRGPFANLVRDLTPPEKEVDIPDGVSEQMVEQMRRIKDTQVRVEAVVEKIADAPAVTESAPVVEEDTLNSFDDSYNNFDEGGYDEFSEGGFEYEEPEPEPEPEPTPEPEVDERSIRMKAQTFESLSEVEEYAYMSCGVPKAVATQIVTRALQSDAVQSGQVSSVALSVMLFCKIFNDKKV